ncbi:MAG TPA: TrmO family methyltransferase [Acidimicrobiales bacterium]|nr:TrmO family methyltransferase [Acidimicrobiales bacterium]
MIEAVHTIVYADDATATRAFLRDVLELANVDAHDGWLIFQLPPAELGVHPAAEPGAPSGHHEIYLLCDDVEATVADLRSKGVEFTEPIADRGFGRTTALRVPGAGTIGLYEARHATAYDLPAGGPTSAGAFSVQAIGTVRGGRADLVDDGWADVESRIELDPHVVEASSTDGLESFSHVDVVYLFDRVDPSAVCAGARHPRGRTDWPKVGILAQRAKDRPNRIGVSTCELVGVDGYVLELRGLDATDGTPVLDVKPHLRGFDARGEVREPEWATELMSGYW